MLLASVGLSFTMLACSAPVEFHARTDDSITIAAEILRPRRAANLPTFVLISGAGPYTRKYSTATGATEVGGYPHLAQRLCAAGFAVVLFDERGVGASSGDYWATATTVRLAQDVATVLGATPRSPETASQRFILLGHSEGGAIAMIAATLSPAVAGIVTLGAPAADLSTIMAWQLSEARAVGEHTYTRRLAEHRTRSADDLWYRTALPLDPLDFARKVCLPALVLHGTLDESVPVAHAALLGATICDGRPGHATVRVLNGHDHALTGAGNGDTLSPEALAVILAWLEKHFGSAG